MKKICVLILIVLITLPLFSQETSDVAVEKNVIKTNILSLIIVTPTIFYERELSDLLSAQLGFGYLNYTINDNGFKGVILTPQLNIYPTKKALDGFYIGPYFRYQNFQIDIDSASAAYNNYGGGIAIGRQWIFKKGFTLNVFFGGHYAKGDIKAKSGNDESFDIAKFEGFRTRFGFALGFAF